MSACPLFPAQVETDALSVVTNPAFADQHPRTRRNAWAALMKQRGNTVNLARLDRMQQHSDIVLSLAAASL